jgi:hypothetical protein
MTDALREIETDVLVAGGGPATVDFPALGSPVSQTVAPPVQAPTTAR